MKHLQAEFGVELLPHVLAIGGIGLWRLTSDGGIVSMSFAPSTLEMFGYEENALGGHWTAFLDQVCHPNYRAQIESAIHNAFMDTNSTIDVEFQAWSKKSNSWRWVYIFGKAQTSDEGSVHLLGGVQDIHDRTATRKALEREQQESLQTIALQASVLTQEVQERTTLIHDIQARVASILGATSPVEPTDMPTMQHRVPEADPGIASDEIEAVFAEDFHKAFDTIAGKMAWYKAVIDSFPFPISVTDMNLRWMYLNRPGLEAVGASNLKDVYGTTAVRWKNLGEHHVDAARDNAENFSFHHAALDCYFQGQASCLFDSDGSIIGHIETMQDVTRVHEADERTRLMLDAMPLCCNFLDKNLNNIDCNQAAIELFDLSCKQEYLERFHELSPEYQPDGARSDEKSAQKVHAAFETGLQVFEWMHQKLDGTPMPVRITLKRVCWRNDYIVIGYTRDLRELKAAQAQRDKERLLLKEVLNSSPLSMLILVDGVARFVTPFAREFLGIQEGEAVSRLYANAADAAEMEHELVTSRKLNWRPLTLKAPDGSLLEMLGNAFYTDYYGEESIIFWLVDITQMRAKECELASAKDVAESSTRAKSDFLANMSHEIRTPMNAVLGMTHLVLRTELTEKQRDYLEKTEQSAKALLRIINEILDFSKIEAGKLEMETVPFSATSVITGVENIISANARERGLQLHISMPSDLPELIEGDPLRLHQILLNLASNAVKFTQDGHVRLGVELMEQTSKYITLLFSVADTGIGMNPAQIARLFSPFTQADTSTTRQYGGTGLGLAISKNLVELMHGAIWCESTPGKGSVFRFSARFRLPKLNSTRTSPSEKRGVPGTSAAADNEDILIKALSPARGMKLLLVEDNTMNQMVAQELLDIAGLDVTVAENGQDALAKAQAGNFDIILMDIQMPVLDGLEATKILRAQPKFAHIPIIAMTAMAMESDKELSLKVGMNDHVTKPIDVAELYTVLAKWLVKPDPL